jgi:hypothetical protein
MYQVAHLDEIEEVPNRDTCLRPCGTHDGITTLGVTTWMGHAAISYVADAC